jgi:NAD-dependent dihydropyrimidine dehydrogenase PreA subunit
MFSLKLRSTACISCGICQDVCQPRAIAMRPATAAGPEGQILLYQFLNSPSNPERPSPVMTTFPYLASPEACNGCGECVHQCPVTALELTQTNQPTAPLSNTA